MAANASLKQTVAECQTGAKTAAEKLLKTFGFVPDNKVSWSPSKTARSSLAVVAHCCMGNQLFAKVLRGEALSPMPTHEDIGKMSAQFEATVRDRATAVRLLEASCEEVVAALATMTDARFATSPNSPFGPLPMTVWASLANTHMSYHMAQMNYLQTIWGDLVDHG